MDLGQQSQHQAFISYASQNQDLANRAYGLLKRSGISCWMAPHDIPPAESWMKAIMQGIKGCDVVVVLLCRHARNSRHVLREIERADHYNKKIITVRVEDVAPSEEMEYLLSLDQWLDAYSVPLDDVVPKIVQMVGALSSTSSRNGRNGTTRSEASGEDDPLDAMPLEDLIAEGLELVCEGAEKLGGQDRVTPSDVGRVLDVAIHYGAPAYNRRSIIGCAEIYWATAGGLLDHVDFRENARGQDWADPFVRFSLELRGIREKFAAVTAENENHVAWALRHAFDRFHTSRGIQEVGELIDKIDATPIPLGRDLLTLPLLLAIQHGNWVFDAKDLHGCAELHHFTARRVCELLAKPDAQSLLEKDSEMRTFSGDLKRILDKNPAINPDQSDKLAWELYETFVRILKAPAS